MRPCSPGVRFRARRLRIAGRERRISSARRPIPRPGTSYGWPTRRRSVRRSSGISRPVHTTGVLSDSSCPRWSRWCGRPPRHCSPRPTGQSSPTPASPRCPSLSCYQLQTNSNEDFSNNMTTDTNRGRGIRRRSPCQTDRTGGAYGPWTRRRPDQGDWSAAWLFRRPVADAPTTMLLSAPTAAQTGSLTSLAHRRCHGLPSITPHITSSRSVPTRPFLLIH